MRKISSLLAAFLLIVLTFTSCRKIVDAIFSGIDVTVPDVSLNIPAIPFVIPIEAPIGTFTQNLNLDSAVKANTNGAFGAGAVTSVKVKTLTINIPNADDNNNLSNFQSARVMLTSNSESNPAELFNVTFPTTNTSTITLTPTNSPELLPYLKGGQLNYEVFGRGRKATSKPLTMTISVVMSVK